MQQTQETVMTALKRLYPDRDTEKLIAILECYGSEVYEREKERVQLAILELSQGNEERLTYFVQMAKLDYRDVLYWHSTGPLAESEGQALQQATRQLLQQWKNKK